MKSYLAKRYVNTWTTNFSIILLLLSIFVIYK